MQPGGLLRRGKCRLLFRRIIWLTRYARQWSRFRRLRVITKVRLTFDKALDEQSVPAPSYRKEFGYDVLPFPSDVYAPIEVTSVAITGKVVTLTLAAKISASDGLVVRHYQQLYKGQPPLQGALGNQVHPIWAGANQLRVTF